MNSFNSDGIEIAYVDEGEGEPILLIHGFASNLVANWIDPGWIAHSSTPGAGSSLLTIAGMGGAANSTIPTAMVRRRWQRTHGGCSIISASPGPT